MPGHEGPASKTMKAEQPEGVVRATESHLIRRDFDQEEELGVGTAPVEREATESCSGTWGLGWGKWGGREWGS